MPFEQNLAFSRVIQPREQLDERGLTRAIRPDERIFRTDDAQATSWSA